MSCLNDLIDLSDDERNAVFAELGRLTRIVPFFATTEATPSLSPDAGAASVVGGPTEQGVQ